MRVRGAGRPAQEREEGTGNKGPWKGQSGSVTMGRSRTDPHQISDRSSSSDLRIGSQIGAPHWISDWIYRSELLIGRPRWKGQRRRICAQVPRVGGRHAPARRGAQAPTARRCPCGWRCNEGKSPLAPPLRHLKRVMVTPQVHDTEPTAQAQGCLLPFPVEFPLR